METKRRSFYKTISWRIVATVTTLVVSYILTGDTTKSLGIASVDTMLKFVFYFFHERAWTRVDWGQRQDYQI